MPQTNHKPFKGHYPLFDHVVQAIERRESSLDNPGFCIACGHEQEGCESDARGYECEECGEGRVYGAEEVLLMGAYR